MRAAPAKLLIIVGAALCAVVIAGCASSVSTSGYSGPDKEVAQTVANLQSDAQASDQKKICSEVLSAAVVAHLGGQKGCESALKTQLKEIDNLEATVHSVKLNGYDRDRDRDRDHRRQEAPEHRHARQGERRLEGLRPAVSGRIGARSTSR